MLFEVLCAVNKSEKVEEVAPEVSTNIKNIICAIMKFHLNVLNFSGIHWRILCKSWMTWIIEQIIAAANDVQAKKEIYAPYNILPLDSAGASQSIMQLEEVLQKHMQIEKIGTYSLE